jgi:hypothetical protein
VNNDFAAALAFFLIALGLRLFLGDNVVELRHPTKRYYVILWLNPDNRSGVICGALGREKKFDDKVMAEREAARLKTLHPEMVYTVNPR